MSFSMKWGDGFTVCCWGEHVKFNLSDHSGDHAIGSAKFKRLPPATKLAIKELAAEAVAESRRKAAAKEASDAAIVKVYRDDMIRYCDKDPWGYAERTLAGTNYDNAKDCAELETFQDLQESRSLGGHAYDNRLSCYYGCLIDGGFVVDKHDVLDKSPGLSLKSPMRDATIRVVERFRDTCGDVDNVLLDALSDLSSFGGLAVLAKAATQIDSIASFDRVPLSVHVAWWRDKGARVGRRVGNTIVWEDGLIENIRPVSERWMVNGKIVDR